MKRFVAVFSAVMLFLALPTLAFAGEGNGSGKGDGSGGGSSEPLTVTSAKTDSSTLEDGATIAPTDVITLTFSKNVNDSSVRDANKALIEVTDSTGALVAVEVVMYDDQVQPEKKNDITIKPQGSYKEGSYVLTAKKGITSKSSVALDEDYVLKFNVKGGAATTSPATTSATTTPSASNTSQPATTTSSSNSINPALIGGIIVVVIIVIAAIALAVSKKKKNAEGSANAESGKDTKNESNTVANDEANNAANNEVGKDTEAGKEE